VIECRFRFSFDLITEMIANGYHNTSLSDIKWYQYQTKDTLLDITRIFLDIYRIDVTHETDSADTNYYFSFSLMYCKSKNKFCLSVKCGVSSLQLRLMYNIDSTIYDTPKSWNSTMDEYTSKLKNKDVIRRLLYIKKTSHNCNNDDPCIWYEDSISYDELDEEAVSNAFSSLEKVSKEHFLLEANLITEKRLYGSIDYLFQEDEDLSVLFD
jgi:hypothetical protein